MLIEIGKLVGEGRAIKATRADGTDAEWLAPDLDLARIGDRDAILADENSASDVGQILFDWLFQGDARRCLQEPLYLNFADDVLPALPWEVICNENVFLARRKGYGVFRVLNAGRPADADGRLPWPMRMAAVSGAPDAGISIKPELRAIKETFTPWGRSVNLSLVEEATKAQFNAALRDGGTQLLHYCGHASANEKGTALSLVGRDGSNDRYAAIDVGAVDVSDLRLVVLNACQTANRGGDGGSRPNAWPLAKAFLAGGARAVVAMQADIQGRTAHRFADLFYRAIFKDDASLEAAMHAARIGLSEDRELSDEGVVWAIPTITFLHPPPPGEYKLFGAYRQPPAIRFHEKRPSSTRFVADAHEQRLRIARWAQAEARPVAVLHGRATGGKSHILRWSLANFAHLGHQIRYVRLANVKPLNVPAILWAIYQGGAEPDEPAGVRVPFEPAGAFDQFSAELRMLLSGQVPGRWESAAGPVDDLDLDLSDEAVERMPKKVGEETVEHYLCGLARKALVACAARRPVTVALDIGGNPHALNDDSLKTLLARLALDEVRRRKVQPDAAERLRFIIESKEAFLLDANGDFLAKNELTGADLDTIEFAKSYRKDQMCELFQELTWYKEAPFVTKLGELLVMEKEESAIDVTMCQQFIELAYFMGRGDDLERHVTDMR